MHIIGAFFIEGMDLRSVAGPSTRIDVSGIHFSIAAPEPPPVQVEPHLLVLVHCPTDHAGDAALEVTYHRRNGAGVAHGAGGTEAVDGDGDDDRVARNVQPLQVEPGKFNYRLVRAELSFEDYGTVEARARIDQGEPITVPFTLLPPAS